MSDPFWRFHLINAKKSIHYHSASESINMVSWKVVLVVIIVALLAMATGMWFGYRYASEQEDIPPEGHYAPSDTALPRHNPPLVLTSMPAEIPLE